MNYYLLSVIVLLGIARLLWTRRKWYSLSWQMIGQSGWPIIGCAWNFVDALKVIENMDLHSKQYGNLSKIWIGPRIFVFINNPVHVEQVLNSPVCTNKGLSYKFIENVLGPGLITMEGQLWRTHRKSLNPSFHYNITNQFVPIFNKHFRIMVEKLHEQSRLTPEFDILHVLKNCSMDMICETTMDREMCTQSGNNADYLEAIDSSMAIAGIRMFNPLRQPDWLFKMSKYCNKQKWNTMVLRETVNQIVDEKKEKVTFDGMTNGGLEHDSASFMEDSFVKEKAIFIDRVIKLSHDDHSFTLDHVLSQTNTILLAGLETTATTMAFVMLMLAMHPKYQQRVYEELQACLGEKTDITHTDLAELKYLDMFVKETLRMFPVVPFLTRTTSADIQIGDFVIPSGVELILGVLAMHRSKDNYPLSPTTFDPDNFLSENVAKRHACSYIPFSGGPRSCIGTRYANIVLKMSVVYVLKSFRITTRLRMEDLKFRMNITLNLLTTHLVRLHRRNDESFALK